MGRQRRCGGGGVCAEEPLFDCVDKTSLAEGANDLMVTCRVISMRSALTEISVTVYVGTDKNFTIDGQLGDGVTETAYEHDNRYVVKLQPFAVVRILLLLFFSPPAQSL